MREVWTTTRFEHRLARFLKKHPELEETFTRTVEMLATGKVSAALHVHKLAGKQDSHLSARIGTTYRLVFIRETRAIGLIDIGTHDDVYR